LFGQLEPAARGDHADGDLVEDVPETASAWVTADLGFARFPGLRWRHPLST
jgi:hypothetical protein